MGQINGDILKLGASSWVVKEECYACDNVGWLSQGSDNRRYCSVCCVAMIEAGNAEWNDEPLKEGRKMIIEPVNEAYRERFEEELDKPIERQRILLEAVLLLRNEIQDLKHLFQLLLKEI